MHLLDLTLLRVFEVLLEEESVTRTAQRLHLTPSAVSHALSRLRIAMNDELFIRGPQQMRPTPLARDIGPRVQGALRELERALAPLPFKPAESTRLFILSMSHYLCLTLLPDVMRQFREAAPQAKIRIRPRLSTLISDLDSGKVDIAIGQFDQLPERVLVEPLISDEWIWVVRRRPKAPRIPLTIERLAALPHALLRVGVSARFSTDSAEIPLEAELSVNDRSTLDLEYALGEHGLSHHVSLEVPDGISALTIAGETDLAALVPRRLARFGEAQFGLDLHEPPYPTSTITFQMASLRSHTQDQGAAWLRSLVKDAAQRIMDKERSLK